MQRVRFKKSLKLVLLLLAVQTLVTWMPNQQAQAAAPSTADLVTDARYVLALAAKENEAYAPYFNRLLRALQTIEVQALPLGTDYAHCKLYRINGYHIPSTKKIFLCERVLKETPDRIVQTIIHESAHVAGFSNECDATRLSIIALMAARRTPEQVGYDCKL